MREEHVLGNTYCIDCYTGSIPFYKLDEKEILFFDCGREVPERKELTEFLDTKGYHPAGVIASHAHIDHTGNCAYLKERYGTQIAMPAFEASASASPEALKAYYFSYTPEETKAFFNSMVTKTDCVIPGDKNEFSFLGRTFHKINTPGHSPEHICIETPDGVLYMGDALMGESVMEHAKLPTVTLLQEDLKTKKSFGVLKYERYILSHKGIYEDIRSLAEKNVSFMEKKVRDILDLIVGEMSFEDILQQIFLQFRIKADSINKFRLIERNTKNYMDYLRDYHLVDTMIKNGRVLYRRTKQ